MWEDEAGPAAVVDALRDAELAPMVLSAVTGDDSPPDGVAPMGESEHAVTLAFRDGRSLWVFPWLYDGPHPGVAWLMGLDEIGFNHLATPVATWRRGGRELGLVQQLPVGSAGGVALALASLRDLYASTSSPEDAGGDFAPEARALGTMTARMHLGVEQAFGRGDARATAWVEVAGSAIEAADPALAAHPGVAGALAVVRSGRSEETVLRSLGDFGLERTARTDQGWVVADCMPSGPPSPAEETTIARSPLADVGDMLWSMHQTAVAAATERDPAHRADVVGKGAAWEARNRSAFMSGYLGTPGIGGLLPADGSLRRALVTVFEAARAAAHPAAGGTGTDQGANWPIDVPG